MSRSRVGSKKLEHGCRMIHAGVRSLFGFANFVVSTVESTAGFSCCRIAASKEEEVNRSLVSLLIVVQEPGSQAPPPPPGAPEANV